jgi:hypothetical protein
MLIEIVFKVDGETMCSVAVDEGEWTRSAFYPNEQETVFIRGDVWSPAREGKPEIGDKSLFEYLVSLYRNTRRGESS